MPILTRRRGETITVGDSIRFSILGITDDQVEVGIDAPEGSPVQCKAVSNRIRAEVTDARPDQYKNEAESEERIVRGIKVKVIWRKTSPEEAAARRAVLLDVVSRSLLRNIGASAMRSIPPV